MLNVLSEYSFKKLTAKTAALKSLLNLRPRTLLKRDSAQHSRTSVFLWILRNFWSFILKNICERLLLEVQQIICTKFDFFRSTSVQLRPQRKNCSEDKAGCVEGVLQTSCTENLSKFIAKHLSWSSFV